MSLRSRAVALAKSLRSAWLPNAAACHVIRGAHRLVGRPVPEWFASHLPKTGTVRVRVPNGTVVRLWSKGDDWVANRLFWYGFDGYEPETTGPFFRLAQRASVVLDVGAHVGYFSLLAAAANPEARVFAFEPLGQVHPRLRRNIALNGGRVEHVDTAVGATTGRAVFYHVPEGIPSSSSLSGEFMSAVPEAVATEVAVVDLDAFTADRTGGQADLLKIDTEATEPDVLRGMARLLDEHRPTIVCEVLPDQGVEAALEEILRRHRYGWALLTAAGTVPRDSIEGHDEDRNWLFTPVDGGSASQPLDVL